MAKVLPSLAATILAVTAVGCHMQGAPLRMDGREIRVYPVFPGAPSTQAIVSRNTVSTIATLSIIPYQEGLPEQYSPLSAISGNPTVDGDPNILKLHQASPVDPSRPFVLRGLKPNQKYRIFGRAYNVAGAQISLDAQSYVDLTVTNDDSPLFGAQLPVVLENIPFGASVQVALGAFPARCDYFKTSLYQGQALISQTQTSQPYPSLSLSSLQGDTTYRFEAEAYKWGQMVSTVSIDLPIANDTTPATFSCTVQVPYAVSLFAGDGTAGYLDGNPSRVAYPVGIAFDRNGDILVADVTNHRVRKVSPSGVVSTLAGDGAGGNVDGPALSAQFMAPHGFAVDPAGNIFLADYWGYRVRKIATDGTVSTFAGDGTSGYIDGTGTGARFGIASEIAIAPDGNFYVSDLQNHLIRKITSTGVVTTFAGGTTPGFVNNTGGLARFNCPSCPIVDPQGNIFVSDTQNHSIRKITPAGVVTTLAGDGTAGHVDGSTAQARFATPQGLALDANGNLYVIDRGNRRVRIITPAGQVSTLAGDGTIGLVDGTGTAARFNDLRGIACDSLGNVFVSDCGNHTIRKLR